MTRKTPDLSTALFGVKIADVFTERRPGPQTNLSDFSKQDIENDSAGFQRIPQFHAVMATDNGQVFSVVTNKYHLLSNQQAIELGEQCFEQVFRLTGLKDMEFYNLNMPSTRSFCHLDFIHKGKALGFKGEEDIWYPFLRITNSYNRTYALNFKLGFCRWICKNGMIFGGQSIDFKFHHGKQIDKAEAQFRLRSGEFADLEKQFFESMFRLERYHVPPKFMWPLTCKLFGIQRPGSSNTRQEEFYTMQKYQIEKLSGQYFKELGENGYAALNILTDFATRPVGYISSEQRIDSLQSKAGTWAEEFIEEIEDRSFSFDAYLGGYLEHAA